MSEKTKIDDPFDHWKTIGAYFIASDSGPYRIRICLTQPAVSVVDSTTGNYVFAAERFSTLIEALTRAEALKTELFEVEKTVEERLKEAEAVISTLNEKIARLESKKVNLSKFEYGQRVRRKDTPGAAFEVMQTRVGFFGREYRQRYEETWHLESELEAV